LDKINELENRISLLENKNSKQKQNNVDISTFYTPNIIFMEWLKQLQPTLDQLDIIFTQGYIQGMSIIICELIERSNEPPILLNHSKKNQFYIYLNDKWCLFDNKLFESLINVIQSKILKLFKEWKDNNPKYLTDEYSDILSKYHQNVLGTKTPKLSTLQRIRTSIYSSLL
tara:strand:- start:8728 stop:9240 length:513 start_codon:yes stop_codon:yes gene_type:complete